LRIKARNIWFVVLVLSLLDICSQYQHGPPQAPPPTPPSPRNPAAWNLQPPPEDANHRTTSFEETYNLYHTEGQKQLDRGIKEKEDFDTSCLNNIEEKFKVAMSEGKTNLERFLNDSKVAGPWYSVAAIPNSNDKNEAQ
jgi:hypothetical protein